MVITLSLRFMADTGAIVPQQLATVARSKQKLRQFLLK
jgi:hypothetical protein